MVAVDIPVSDVEDLVRTSVPPGSRLHVFVVDRADETVLIHPFFRNSFEVSPQCCVTLFDRNINRIQRIHATTCGSWEL